MKEKIRKVIEVIEEIGKFVSEFTTNIFWFVIGVLLIFLTGVVLILGISVLFGEIVTSLGGTWNGPHF